MHFYSSSLPTPSIDTSSVSKTAYVSRCCWTHESLLPTQDAVGGDGTCAARSVSPVRLDGELPLLSRAHVEQTLVPTLDDLALAYSKGKRLSAVVRGIEFAAIRLQCTAVMNIDLIASNSLALALDRDGDFGLEVLCRAVSLRTVPLQEELLIPRC